MTDGLRAVAPELRRLPSVTPDISGYQVSVRTAADEARARAAAAYAGSARAAAAYEAQLRTRGNLALEEGRAMVQAQLNRLEGYAAERARDVEGWAVESIQRAAGGALQDALKNVTGSMGIVSEVAGYVMPAVGVAMLAAQGATVFAAWLNQELVSIFGLEQVGAAIRHQHRAWVRLMEAADGGRRLPRFDRTFRIWCVLGCNIQGFAVWETARDPEKFRPGGSAAALENGRVWLDERGNLVVSPEGWLMDPGGMSPEMIGEFRGWGGETAIIADRYLRVGPDGAPHIISPYILPREVPAIPTIYRRLWALDPGPGLDSVARDTVLAWEREQEAYGHRLGVDRLPIDWGPIGARDAVAWFLDSDLVRAMFLRDPAHSDFAKGLTSADYFWLCQTLAADRSPENVAALERVDFEPGEPLERVVFIGREVRAGRLTLAAAEQIAGPELGPLVRIAAEGLPEEAGGEGLL